MVTLLGGFSHKTAYIGVKSKDLSPTAVIPSKDMPRSIMPTRPGDLPTGRVDAGSRWLRVSEILSEFSISITNLFTGIIHHGEYAYTIVQRTQLTVLPLIHPSSPLTLFFLNSQSVHINRVESGQRPSSDLLESSSSDTTPVSPSTSSEYTAFWTSLGSK